MRTFTNRERRRRLSAAAKWFIAAAATFAGYGLAQFRTGQRILVIVVPLLLLGWAIAWMTGATRRLPGSGRDPRDVGLARSADDKYQTPGG